MFDRPPPSHPDAAEVAESVDRLCRLYDSRLAETGGDLSPEDAREQDRGGHVVAAAERPTVLVEGRALGDLCDHMSTVDAPHPA